MKLSFDLTAGSLYIRLSSLPVARTREVDDNTNVDLTELGDVVGIEVISIAHPWPIRRVLDTYKIPDFEAAQIRGYFMPSAAGLSQLQAPAVSAERIAPALVDA